ncbi:MAG TPA: PLP-dependent aspartate aminotransferase family protein [Spirochaetia bacterium]|nr:PLP-dependent aspartate aminotransferase family protein [Spirochaetia bacterium]
MELRTSCVHTGVYKDGTYNSVTTPIYPTSTFAFDRLGEHRGYDYTRTGNPTRAALQENIAAIEKGAGCAATATGMAAEVPVLFLLSPGDHVVTGNDIYGGTFRLFSSVMARMGIRFSFVDMRDPANIRGAVVPETRMIWVETPSNPLLHIVDISAAASIASEANSSRGPENRILTVVDNTFLSPYFQRPLELGADLVVHSTTKYLNGHSDVVGGAIVWKDPALGERTKFLVNALGVPEAPFDAWLVLRGLKTLGPRMELHQQNALALAEFLRGHPAAKAVHYTGLDTHPQRDLIIRQQHGHGGMLAFELDRSRVDINRFFERLTLFHLAESLGGVESLIEHPWSMSHASMGAEGLATSGLTEETIRVSAGIEDSRDLVADFKQALS